MFKVILSIAMLFSLFLESSSAQSNQNKIVSQVVAPKESIDKLREISPDFAKLTDDVLFKEIWNRPGLSARDKSLVTLSVLVATNRLDQVESHIKLGLKNGLTEKEIESIMIHIAFYAGWPSGINGLQRYKNILNELQGIKNEDKKTGK